jgi:hypothetical protein
VSDAKPDAKIQPSPLCPTDAVRSPSGTVAPSAAPIATHIWQQPKHRVQQLRIQVVYEQGITEQPVSKETIRRALLRRVANWKPAKHWITSPDPNYSLKKSGANV